VTRGSPRPPSGGATGRALRLAAISLCLAGALALAGTLVGGPGAGAGSPAALAADPTPAALAADPTPAASATVSAATAAAASPAPAASSGDTRSAGEAPGFVGAPLLAIVGVLVIGAASALGTLLYVRLTGPVPDRSSHAGDPGEDPGGAGG